MHPAGHPRSVTVPPTTGSTSHIAPQFGLSPSSHDSTRQDAPPGARSSNHSNMNRSRLERFRNLTIAIRQRIETRLAGRVRDLAVRVRGETIVLEGSCATYYTKQLAQHAALGALDGEPLENAITVRL